jgi:hypothetical protein
LPKKTALQSWVAIVSGHTDSGSTSPTLLKD